MTQTNPRGGKTPKKTRPSKKKKKKKPNNLGRWKFHKSKSSSLQCLRKSPYERLAHRDQYNLPLLSGINVPLGVF